VSFAQAFAEAGADVVLGARRVDMLAETAALVEATGRKALTLATDVSVPEQCQALVDSAMQTFGRVDILINNAGVGTARLLGGTGERAGHAAREFDHQHRQRPGDHHR
jgi:NAD(P)-dependent dehydrogenase (short-subunit alcohol dehydrogenase family)